MTAIRRIVDLRHLLSSPVLDQGQRPTCLALATSQVHQASRGSSPLAPDAIVAAVVRSRGTIDGGMYTADVATALLNTGQPELSVWPLQTGLGEVSTPPPNCTNYPWYRTDLKNHSLHHVLDDALDDGELAVICIELTEDFYQTDGSDTPVDADSQLCNGYPRHAVVCVGRGVTPQGDDVYLVRNSWGSHWGAGGEAWLTYDYVRQHCYEVNRISRVLPEP